MIKEIFPGLAGMTVNATCFCVCGCTASDPQADDSGDDKSGEGKSTSFSDD